MRFIPDGTSEQIQWFNDLQRSHDIAGNCQFVFARPCDEIDMTGLAAARFRSPTLVLALPRRCGGPVSSEGRRLAAGIPERALCPARKR